MATAPHPQVVQASDPAPAEQILNVLTGHLVADDRAPAKRSPAPETPRRRGRRITSSAGEDLVTTTD